MTTLTQDVIPNRSPGPSAPRPRVTLGDADTQTSVPHTGLLKNPPLLTTHRTERETYREGVWSALKGPREASGNLREKAGPGQALWQSCRADDHPC